MARYSVLKLILKEILYGYKMSKVGRDFRVLLC